MSLWYGFGFLNENSDENVGFSKGRGEILDFYLCIRLSFDGILGEIFEGFFAIFCIK